MKIVVFFLLLAFSSPARGDIAIRTVFDVSTNQTCNDADWDIVRGSRRNLRSDRQLFDPWWCNWYCEYFPRGQCYIAYKQCERTRRRRLEEISETTAMPHKLTEETSRGLSFADDCNAEMTIVNARYDNATSHVSTDCKAVLNSPRNHTCYEIFDTENDDSCGITRFSLWNAYSDVVVNANFKNGDSFCRSPWKFSIEAIASGVDCVDEVFFQLDGPDGYSHNRTETTAPFTLFKNRGSNYRGQRLAVGTYHLTVTPSGSSDFSPKTILFNIDDC